MDAQKTHSYDGWLRTGDLGVLDDKKDDYLSRGELKEMIKRGGEQVWPNKFDDLVEKVARVYMACSFGVPNELWGEEVAVAVVFSEPNQHGNSACLDDLKGDIIKACADELDEMWYEFGSG